MIPRVEPRYLPRVAQYPPGACFGPRILEDYELVWILTGSARWNFEGPLGGRVEAELVPGSVLLARAGGIDSYRWDSRHRSSHGYVHFVWPAAPPEAVQAAWTLVRQPPDSRPIRALCDYLLTLSRRDDEESRRRCADVLGLAVDLLLHGPLDERPAEPESPHVRAALVSVRAIWQDEGMRRVRLDELARAAGVTAAHLSREFGREFDGGIVAALELVRLGRAATRLQRSNELVGVIAVACGFGDPYHFSRRFSRAYGSPPTRYRRERHGDDPLAPLARAGLVPVWDAVAGLTA